MTQQLGCTIEPVPQDVQSIEPMLGGALLPEQYIVPKWRGAFDDEFRPIQTEIRARILNQGQQDSCVGHGTSVQKSAQENILISPRDIFTGAKLYDGNPQGFGTTISAAQKALVNEGAAEAELVNGNPSVPLMVYRDRASYSTAVVVANRSLHKGRTPYYVSRDLIRQTIFETEIPVVTACMWYEQDNEIGANGMMRMPNTGALNGHCFACIGWIKINGITVKVMVNSFGPDWGANGIFFVPEGDVSRRLTAGYITLDIEPDIAAILAKYEGHDVRVGQTADHIRIEKGKKRKYPDEITWWAHGRLFGIDVFDITAEELAVIPEGLPMSIDEAPFASRELTRQVRQFYGKL